MILFYRGYGFWIPLIPILSILIEVCFLNTDFIVFYILTIAGYILTAYQGIKLNRNPIKKYKNLKTGEIFELVERHEFFFMPMQFFSILGIILIGIIIYIRL